MAALFSKEFSSDSEEDGDYIPDYTSDDFSSDEDPLLRDEMKTKETLKGKEDKKVSHEDSSPKEKVDEKQKASDIYKSFLEEVEAEMKEKEVSSGSVVDSPMLSSNSSVKSSTSSSYETTPQKPSCELFDFAGETVSVTSENGTKLLFASSDLVIGKNVSTEPIDQPPVVKRKGLESVLGTILNKKPKLSVLDKSSIDWNAFKKEHSLSEDLSKFNKGRGGYIGRQRFLERSDIRSYEVERDLRLSKNKKNC